MPQGRTLAFATINNHQKSFSKVQFLVTRRLEKQGQDLFVFCARLHKPEQVVLTGHRNALGHDHRHVREDLSIRNHGYYIQLAQVAVLEHLQLLRTGVGKGARNYGTEIAQLLLGPPLRRPHNSDRKCYTSSCL